jgi:ribose-phosphate pyrophosphokinase
MFKVYQKYYNNSNAIKFHTFSGGEEHVNVAGIYPGDPVTITARIDSSTEFMRLLLLTDAIKRIGVKEITLQMPYIPYARQDRVCANGDAFSLKIFANLINQQGYKKVFVTDAHSSVSTALIDNVVEVDQAFFVDLIYDKNRDFEYIIAPDAGASKKATNFAKMYSSRIGNTIDVVQALKVRDTSNGNITQTQILHDDFDGKSCLIVDDICDGGATFIELTKKLKEKNAGKVGLFVTHGIFSRGLDPLFENGIDEIYTTDTFEQKDTRVQIIFQYFK